MSTSGGLDPVQLDCPQCGQPVAVQAHGHIDADRDVALREKLLAADAGLDGATLEQLKLLLMRDMQEPPLPLGAELRLSEVSSQSLITTVLDRQGRPLENLDVPHDLLADITADPEGWASLDSDLRAGPFVDVQRLVRG